MPLFDNLRKELNYLKESEITIIHKAYLLAEAAHNEQKRDTGEPYLVHPVAVAIILAAMHLDYQSIIAALLHDVVEDTSVSKETISNQFGAVVAEIVDGVTKLSQIEFANRAEAQAESFRKMIMAMSRDIRVILVKLADRLHNMSTMHSLSVERKQRISKETLDIYAPIANRLGMHTLSSELEDLSFAIRYPNRSRVLRDEVKKIRATHQTLFTNIENNLRRALEQNSLRNTQILFREKHLYSIYRRMQRYHCSFAEATNMCAFRVLVQDAPTCYLVLGILHSLYKPILGKFEDYIAIPKFNGYQSLHTFLFGPKGMPIEAQIRTFMMDKMADYGIVTHWLNSTETDKSTESAQARAQRWIGNLLEMQQNTASSLEFVDNVKSDLFPDEIYVFTPRGSIIELPKGATLVDFAYAVHTDIGNTCVAAKVDQQFVPLSNILKSGQTVSIITMPDAKPNPAWLNFIVTGRARGGIRNFLKTQKHSEAVLLGKQLLEKALADLGTTINKIPRDIWENMLLSGNFKTDEDLYEDIGLGNSISIFIAHQLLNTSPDQLSNDPMKGTTKTLKPLLIRGAQGMAVSFASCCYPLPGDQIVGYLQADQGLVIHRQDCSAFARLHKRPEACMPVLWADDVKGEFKAAVNVEMANQRGVLAALAHAVSAAEANIEDVRINERSSGYCQMVLLLLVKSLMHLERIIRHISNIPTIIGVTRVKN